MPGDDPLRVKRAMAAVTGWSISAPVYAVCGLAKTTFCSATMIAIRFFVVKIRNRLRSEFHAIDAAGGVFSCHDGVARKECTSGELVQTNNDQSESERFAGTAEHPAHL